jgi:hypothetical protein
MVTIGLRGVLAAAALATLSCAGFASESAKGKASVKCGYVPAPAGFLVPGRIVLFGEFPGTKELPQAFGELACQAAMIGPTLVGLELPQSEGDQLQAYLAATGAPARAAILRASPFWTDAYQDGRRSVAMATLLTRLGTLRAAGLPIEVFAFDPDPPAGPDRAERMADAIAARARPDARVMVLVRAAQARTAAGPEDDPASRPAGSFLEGAGLDVVAFDFAGPPGSAWTCPDAEPAHCGKGDLKPRNAVGAPGITVDPGASGGYRGRWSVPKLTASPPSQR